jgi:hypothetical protein
LWMVKEVEMKPAMKIPIRGVLISLLVVEMAAFLFWRHRAPTSALPPPVRVADMAASGLGRPPPVALPRVWPARVEDPGFAALAESPPPASEGPPADADAAKDSLCGGMACRADQFCCGPPACGRCVSELRGPRCPKTCS